ncbi:hypothetical protein NDU88_000396 [Pleurodeles waltl]|uniref:Uncharacterized protein n=1 Tax=Pleurodeles waltl TaxID=8319 RepID=A0AAV7TET2_PLEWA|nr:hypothetical protein NDU88_000396 [Pleurodeles waltl]
MCRCVLPGSRPGRGGSEVMRGQARPLSPYPSSGLDGRRTEIGAPDAAPGTTRAIARRKEGGVGGQGGLRTLEWVRVRPQSKPSLARRFLEGTWRPADACRGGALSRSGGVHAERAPPLAQFLGGGCHSGGKE